MIIKTLLLIDDKLVNTCLSINIFETSLVINLIHKTDYIVKIPIYNKYNGIDYYPIIFPLEMIIYNKYLFSPYIILSSYNFDIENEIDFFYNITHIIKNSYNLNIIHFNNTLLSDKILKEINIDIDTKDINEFIKSIWNNINMIKLVAIYFNIKQKINIPKKILLLCNQIKSIPYKLFIDNNKPRTFIEYYNFNYDSCMKLTDLMINNKYYIMNKNKKIIKVHILNINKHIIQINSLKNIIFDDYSWYEYYPNKKIDKNYIIYQTFINEDYTNEIIKQLYMVNNTKIIKYYMSENKLSNLVNLFNNYVELKDVYNDVNILRLNSYSDEFFIYITHTYSDTRLIDILEILFNNYNYPLKSNRHDMNKQFDYLLYFSMINYKQILLKNIPNNYSNDILEPNINVIIPKKLKNLYINILKLLTQLLDNNFEIIIYNQKFYNDYLYKSIIKLFVSNNNNLSIKLFKSMINEKTFIKFKHIIFTNLLLIDIIEKLNWNNISKKLNYIDFFYKNTDIIYYKDKLNKNILPDNFDNRIKKIIENPFEMYKFLKKENDFIKWTKFISDKIIDLYYVPISISTEDYIYIGKLIYLLLNITEQTINNPYYNDFINFCNQHHNIILDMNRINFKIKEHFQCLKTNINLGFLAKHLTINKDIISLEEPILDKSNDIIILESKLKLSNNKYFKYKNKYLRTKNMNNNDIYDSETSEN